MKQYITFITILALTGIHCALYGAEMNKKSSPESLNTASTYSKLCQEEDLYGLWKVVKWTPYFEVKGKEWNQPEFLKNQWLLFDGEGGMKYLASNMEIKLDEVQRKLSDEKSKMTVEFKRKGFMDIQAPKKDAEPEHWRCAVAEKDLTITSMNLEVKKGDILMTMFGKDNTIRYFRLLRHIKE